MVLLRFAFYSVHFILGLSLEVPRVNCNVYFYSVLLGCKVAFLFTNHWVCAQILLLLLTRSFRQTETVIDYFSYFVMKVILIDIQTHENQIVIERKKVPKCICVTDIEK